jgi:hypothetical protein
MTPVNKDQQEKHLIEIIEDMEEFTAPPRVYTVALFKDMQTEVIHYDKFVAIKEYGEYVALGRHPTGNFFEGSVQLMDIREVEDPRLRRRGTVAFDELKERKKISYTREIEGDWNTDVIVKHIIDTWVYTEERKKAIIH